MPKKALTRKQFLKIREDLGLSQAAMGEALNVHAMTISKWERGAQPIPPMTETALRWVQHEHAQK